MILFRSDENCYFLTRYFEFMPPVVMGFVVEMSLSCGSFVSQNASKVANYCSTAFLFCGNLASLFKYGKL